ncbi:M48 family metallopeptidase [Haloarcula argentinensis]|uniref:Heat-shock protein HtpX n=1 Tax=Haloarcula argentinensis TaxID=43776 RepID=A0A830FQI9_HALAR|nr:M48 family metalloprotease [Haloarcula argentinensis]GGM46830.1 heat-shock protein HtpX [Haloarcula argentinensis]
MAALQSTTWSLRARLIALAVVLVAFDAVAVGVAYVLGHVAFGLLPLVGYDTGTLFWTMGFDIVPLWPVLLVGTPLVLAVQSIYGYRMTLRGSGTTATESRASDPESVDEMRAEIRRSETADRLRERVARLAQTADMATPDVTVIDAESPNSYVASRPGEQTLFVTTALVDQLDGAELDAVIAHELAHLKNGDAFVMTAAAFLPTVSALFTRTLGRAVQYSGLCHWFLGGDDRDGTWFAGGNIQIVMLLFAVIAIPVTATLYLASTACYRLLSRIREYAADAGGVAICGSPAALASALETLTDDQRPDTDIRTAETGVRELCVVPHAIAPDEQTSPDGRAERLAHRWRSVSERLLPGSHPDVDDRIAALQERQSALDQYEQP